jgi:hypothetical protein
VYELMALVYRPLFQVLVDDLRQRLQRGEKQVFQGEWAVFETNAINWRDPARRWQEPMISVWNDDLLPRFEKITADYFAADLNAIPGAFAGSDVEAVAAAMADLQEQGITAETYADMRTPTLVRANYPLVADL